MTHTQRLNKLDSLGWHHDETSGRHLICGERCDFISGEISGVKYDAWIAERSGFVYIQDSRLDEKDMDQSFERFCATVRDGWLVPKVVPVVRGFDFGDD